MQFKYLFYTSVTKSSHVEMNHYRRNLLLLYLCMNTFYMHKSVINVGSTFRGEICLPAPDLWKIKTAAKQTLRQEIWVLLQNKKQLWHLGVHTLEESGCSYLCLELEHTTFHFKLFHLEGASSLTRYRWAELLPSSTTQNRSSCVSISKISRKDHIPDWLTGYKASRADIPSIPLYHTKGRMKAKNSWPGTL